VSGRQRKQSIGESSSDVNSRAQSVLDQFTVGRRHVQVDKGPGGFSTSRRELR